MGSGGHRAITTDVHLREEIVLFPILHSGNKTHKFGAGSHEWPFWFRIPSDRPESVEGMPFIWNAYKLTLSVDRGFLSRELSVSKHIRIIRLMDPDPFDGVHQEQACVQCRASFGQACS